jgi:hypothetical protein
MTYRALIVEPAVMDRLSGEERKLIADIESQRQVVWWKGVEETDGFLAQLYCMDPNPFVFTPFSLDLRIRYVYKRGFAYLLLFNEGGGEIQTRLSFKDSSLVGNGVLVDMDTGREKPWQSNASLNLSPHGCAVLALPIATHST